MFRKNNTSGTGLAKPAAAKKDAIPSVVAKDMHILGNIISDGNADFSGTLDGNIRCATLILRDSGVINGEIIADNALIYGKVKGLIRARNVQFFSTCRVEGIIMHESMTIEDGAFVDGKFKRTDKPASGHPANDEEDDTLEDNDFGGMRMLENIRLIR